MVTVNFATAARKEFSSAVPFHSTLPSLVSFTNLSSNSLICSCTAMSCSRLLDGDDDSLKHVNLIGDNQVQRDRINVPGACHRLSDLFFHLTELSYSFPDLRAMDRIGLHAVNAHQVSTHQSVLVHCLSPCSISV